MAVGRLSAQPTSATGGRVSFTPRRRVRVAARRAAATAAGRRGGGAATQAQTALCAGWSVVYATQAMYVAFEIFSKQPAS
eukprot:6172512-Pleurochrysis_carterae.AAC.7